MWRNLYAKLTADSQGRLPAPVAATAPADPRLQRA
jgi:hypothetical protein